MNYKKLLLTLTLCLCALLCMVVTASASEVSVHSHPVCGKTHTDIGDHTGTCGNVTWTAWNGPAANGDTNITYDSNNTAYIYLADNVTTEYSIEVREGKTLYLCLNGHSITKTSEDYDESHNRSDANGVIDGRAGNVTFALCNCKTNGTITHTSGKNGRGVWVKGTFIMYGGTISGNNCVYGAGGGGGVYVDGTFIMYGGTIKENKSTSHNGGGGVEADCRTFAMYGGTISGNESMNGLGGGISLNMGYSPSGVKAIISGGAITNNKAADMGGGVHIANGTLTLSGNTTITGNTCGADSHGGGVSTYQATIELASKDVTIENNKNGSGVQANLYLRSKASYTDPSYISVTGDLGSKVFTLTTEKTPTVGTPVTISQYCDTAVLNAQNFKYENNDQVSIVVIPTGGQALLKACIHSFTKTSAASEYLKSSATCTSKAVYYKSCACGLASSTETFTSGAINPNNHDLVHHEAQAPTCTAVGWEAYDTCSRCDYTTKVEKQKTPHTYGTVSYTWATDNTTCKAEHKCTACQHVENETVNAQKQVTQNHSCTLNELSTFTATFTNTAFAQQIKENVKTADMTGHSYGTPTYIWAANNASCTATRTCTACQHVENETVNTQKQVTQNRSCTLNELSTFTATFTNTAFAQQTKENVKTADMTGHSYGTPTYVWAANNDSCTATRTCTACQHVENETVNTQKQVTQNRSCTLNELSTFTATFTNTAFAQQTKENVKTADMAAHTYSETWVKGQDGHWKVCEVCQNRSEVEPHNWRDATTSAPKTCTVCGATTGTKLSTYYYYSPAKTEDTPGSPKAGDPGVLLYAGLALASLTGLTYTAKKRH